MRDIVWRQINGIYLLKVIWTKKQWKRLLFCMKKNPQKLNIPHEKMKSLYYIWEVSTITGDFIRRMKQGKIKNVMDRDRKSIDSHYWGRVGNMYILGLAFIGLKLLPGSSHPVGMPRLILWQCSAVDKLMLK